MIRRSTLLFLTCLAACGPVVLRPKSPAVAVNMLPANLSSTQTLLAQANSGVAAPLGAPGMTTTGAVAPGAPGAIPGTAAAQPELAQPATAPYGSFQSENTQPEAVQTGNLPAGNFQTGSVQPNITQPGTIPGNAQPAFAQPNAVQLAQVSSGVSVTDLGVNSQGEAVKALQSRLQQSGHYDGPIDGLYGIATQQSVKAFQTEAGLEPTGSINEETGKKIWTGSGEGLLVQADTDAGTAAEGSPSAANEPAIAPPVGSDLSTQVAEQSAQGETDDEASGIGKMLPFIGLAALLSLGGVGFYLFKRKQTNTSDDEGEWGELDSDIAPASRLSSAQGPIVFNDASATRSNSLQPNAFNSAEATVVNNGRNLNQNNGFNNSANNGFSQGQNNGLNGGLNNGLNGGAMSTGLSKNNMHNANFSGTSASLRTSGQMGDAMPLAPTDIIEGLVGDLRNPDPAKRRKAIWELGQRGNSLAMQPLVDSMVNADSKEKSLVLAALSEIGIRSLKPMSRALAIALQDDNPEVRKNAIRDLTRVYDLVVQISQMLGHATEDEDPEVRQTASWALDQLNRIRRSQDIDVSVRAFTSGSGTATPIDFSSEASIRRSQQNL
jgi:peptidoglycan hydrolase-like protein with peptidoglycan-binding domain